MNLLNPIMAWGVAALAIPLIIHLFHKSRFKIVPWGAMHLLVAVLRTNQKRIKIEQWILLAIRCAIPAILALMMAKPAWEGAKRMLGDDAVSTVVLLDNSYSMEAGRAGTSNFTIARDESQRLVSQLKTGSDAYVFLMGEGTGLLDQASSDIPRVSEALGKVGASYGVARVPAALDFVSPVLDKMTQPARQVVVLTDFQKVSFPPTDDKLLGQSIERLKALRVPPTVTLWDVGADVKENVAIESLDFSKLMVGVGQKVQFKANVRNFGDTARPDVRVTLRVDGVPLPKSVQQISLGSRAQGQVLFTHIFDKPGSHVVEVDAGSDSVKADNSFLASIPVRDKLPVLLVDGAPGAGAEDLKSEIFYAQIALAPFASGKIVEQADLIQTKAVTPEALNAKIISESAVVVLANVAKVGDEQMKALELFVKQGGGLLVFTGDRTDATWWNGPFAKLAPLGLGGVAGDANAKDDKAAKVADQRFSNPALEIFNDPRNGRLSEAAIKAWHRLKPPERTGGLDDPVVLARFESGDPFLAEKAYGEGRVVVCSTTLDSDWNNFPTRPSYLPLIQRLCVYLASNVYPPRNLRVGEQLVSFVPAESAGKKALLTLPDASTVEVPVVKKGERGVVEYPSTQRPGLYTLVPAGGAPIHYVVNADRSESDLTRLTEAEIKALAKANGVQLVRSVEEFKALDKAQRYGREIWKWALLLLLALLFAELILQQMFARGRSKA